MQDLNRISEEITRKRQESNSAAGRPETSDGKKNGLRVAASSSPDLIKRDEPVARQGDVVPDLQTQLTDLQQQFALLRQEIKTTRLEGEKRAKALASLQKDFEAERAERLRDEDEIREAIHELQSAQENMGVVGTELSRQIVYRQLVRRVREVVRDALPRDASVVVVSKGDNELLKLPVKQAGHFPQAKDGIYAGYYPRNSTAAIVHLEVLRAKGATHLLFPATALWWLNEQKYAEFKNYLERRYRAVVRREDACVIFALREPAVWTEFDDIITDCQSRLDREPTILDWDTGQDLIARFPQYTVFSPPTQDQTLPYLDHSVDLVAVASSDAGIVAEARRVAREAVIFFTSVEQSVAGEDAAPAAREPDCAIKVEWLDDGTASELPSVSIIIPVYNKIEYTETCLASLRETLPRNFRGEIVVVDDASTDETPARLKHWAKLDKRIKVLRNTRNAGFLASSTRGVSASTGEIILFLNNDTVLLQGWLLPLLRIFRNYPDAGAVGGKLLFQDGTLQEAGGIIFRDGSGANFGRGDQEPDALLYNYVREVDYCSGALLATKRSLFLELGGFDTRYSPAYCEDSDYCFAVREKGYRVYYQPASTIVHIEGATSGTDLSSGVKRYQVINGEKFAAKWKEALRRQPVRPDYSDHEAWQALAERKEIEGDEN